MNEPTNASSARNYHPLLWCLLFGSHVTAVLCSRGYYHPDEHFQVLAFVQWKLGLVAGDDMPWELHERMRPWLHPLIFFPVEWSSARLFELSPFVRAALHRACVAALALLVIRKLTRDADPRLLFLFATLFFYPFLDARISSEVIGGWLFALGYVLDRDDDADRAPRAARAIGVGLILGLAGAIRLQVWAMILGLLLFHLLRRRIRHVLWMALGAAIATAVGVLADCWGYGQFTFVPWTYVHQNVVLDKASRFGTSPPYEYALALLESSAYLPGAILIAALLWQWFKRPVTKLSFATLPFVLVHLAIAHKELRFLFPLAPLVPFILLALWDDLGALPRTRKTVGLAFLTVNLTLLVPASVNDVLPEIGLYQALRAHVTDPAETLYCRGDRAVCKKLLGPAGRYMSYYLGPTERPVRVVKRNRPLPGLLATTTLHEFERADHRGVCQLLESRYPAPVRSGLRHVLSRERANDVVMWALWRCA